MLCLGGESRRSPGQGWRETASSQAAVVNLKVRETPWGVVTLYTEMFPQFSSRKHLCVFVVRNLCISYPGTLIVEDPEKRCA